MSLVDPMVIIIAVIYLIIVVVIGWYSRLRLKSPLDYYVAGRTLGSVVNGLALMSTYFSPASMMGIPAYILLLGYPFTWAQAAIIAGMPLATLLVAVPLRKYAPMSFADYYADRYHDEKLRWVVMVIVFIGGLLYTVLSLVGMGLAMVAILRIPYIIGLLIGTVITMIYILWGGMIATSWNAAYQSIVMTFVVILVTAVILASLGGLEGVYHTALKSYPRIWSTPADAPAVPNVLTGSWIGVIGWYLSWHLGFAVMPYSVVRFFTTMDVKSARRSIFWCTLFSGAFYVCLAIIGISTKYLIEKFHPLQTGGLNALQILGIIQKTYGIGTLADYSLIAVVESLGNPLLLGLLCAGALAVAMSTAAGWAIVINVLMVRDIAVKLLNSKRVAEKQVFYARLISAIFLVICFFVAISPPGLVADLSGWSFVLIISSIGPGLILGLWWKRATRTAMWATAVVMSVLHTIAWLRAHLVLGHHARFFLNDILFGDVNALITPNQVWTLPLGFVIFVILSLLTKPSPEEVVKKYCVELTKEV
jgi:SSS family solute:Na+ symporter